MRIARVGVVDHSQPSLLCFMTDNNALQCLLLVHEMGQFLGRWLCTSDSRTSLPISLEGELFQSRGYSATNADEISILNLWVQGLGLS